MALKIPRNAYSAGEILEGTVVVETSARRSDPGLHLEFRGLEITEIKEDTGKKRDFHRSSHDVVTRRVPIQVDSPLPKGTHHFPFQFQIPPDVFPSYHGRHASVRYSLAARLDSPGEPDIMGSEEIFVFSDGQIVRRASKPLRFRSEHGGPEVYVELAGDRLLATDRVLCRITLARLGSAHVRRVYLRLVGTEWARVGSAEAISETFRDEWQVPAQAIRTGVPFVFELAVPGNIPSSYRGAISYHAYTIHVCLDISWGLDIIASAPVFIAR